MPLCTKASMEDYVFIQRKRKNYQCCRRRNMTEATTHRHRKRRSSVEEQAVQKYPVTKESFSGRDKERSLMMIETVETRNADLSKQKRFGLTGRGFNGDWWLTAN